MTRADARNPRLDTLIGLFSLWISFSFFIDAWAHENEPVETFFTPSHGLIYGGMAALAGTLFFMRKRIPSDYRLPLLGIPIFLIGGAADLVWHTLYGIETGIDIVLSPTHETIGFGLLLVASGPIISAVRHRGEMRTLRDQLPFILSLAAWLEMVHFATSYALQPHAAMMDAPPSSTGFSPDYFTALAITYYKLGGGIVILLLQMFIMASFTLFAATRLDLRPGALTLLLVLGNTMATVPFTNHTPLLAATFLMSLFAGICGDAAIARSRRTGGMGSYRLAGTVVPPVYVATYFVVTHATGGVWWDWDVQTSMVIFAAVIGFGLGALIVPPQQLPAAP